MLYENNGETLDINNKNEEIHKYVKMNNTLLKKTTYQRRSLK